MVDGRSRKYNALRAIAACLCVVPISGAVAETAVPADSMIDVGGYRLYMRALGGRGVTIVLESGGTLTSEQWSSIQPKLHAATGAAVVSYDRPGFGESDLPPGPYRIEDEVVALHRALTQLQLPRRLVLVGHSYGAFNVQLYAARHADSVAGVVLIEPNTVGIVDAIGGVSKLTYDIHPGMPRKLALAKTRLRDALPETMEILRHAPLPASIPVTVISAGERWGPSDEFNDALRTGHRALVTGFANRKLIVAEHSGHMVNEDRPDILLDAVDSMVAAVRDPHPDRCAHE